MVSFQVQKMCLASANNCSPSFNWRLSAAIFANWSARWFSSLVMSSTAINDDCFAVSLRSYGIDCCKSVLTSSTCTPIFCANLMPKVIILRSASLELVRSWNFAMISTLVLLFELNTADAPTAPIVFATCRYIVTASPSSLCWSSFRTGCFSSADGRAPASVFITCTPLWPGAIPYSILLAITWSPYTTIYGTLGAWDLHTEICLVNSS